MPRKHLLVFATATAAALLLVGIVVSTRAQRSGPDTQTGPIMTVPPAITSDCSRAVDTEINAFVAGVPNGATVLFGPKACYGLERSVRLSDRADLTLDGRGSTFKMLVTREEEPCQSNWRIEAGSNITLKNITVQGLHRPGGFDVPRLTTRAAQCQHGFTFDSVQGGKLLDSKAFDVFSDPVSIEPDTRKGDYCAVPPNRNILIDRFHGFNAGRTLGITHADGVVVQNSYIGDMWDNSIDLETDVDCQWTRNIKILNNRFGRAHYAVVAYGGSEPPQRSGNFEFSGNVSEVEPTSCYPPIFIRPLHVFEDPEGKWASLYGPENPRRNFTIRNNDLRTLGQGVLIYNAANVVIEGNKVSQNYGTGCANETQAWYPKSYGAVLVDIRGANVSGNTLVNGPNGSLEGEMYVSATSTGVTTNARPSSRPAAKSP